MVRESLSKIKKCSDKHRESIDSMLKQSVWTSRQQEFAIFLIERYLPNVNIFDLVRERTKEDMLLDAREEIKKEVDVADIIKNSDTLQVNVPLKTQLYDHQKKAFALGMALTNIALLMEMGTGKTLSAISISGQRFLNKEVNKLLVVAPLSVLHVWKLEFEKHSNFPYIIYIQEIGEFIPNKLNVCVVSYETSWRIGDNISNWKPDMIIADESQKIKGSDSKRSKFLHELSDNVKYKMILTGTPITQTPIDAFSQYRFLNKAIFGDSISKFKDKYAIVDEFNRPISYKNLDDLSNKAHSIAYRVRKEDVLDLPPYVDQILYCELNESKEKYEMLKKEIKELFSKSTVTRDSVLGQIQRLSQITGGFYSETDKFGSRNIIQIGTEKLNLFKNVVSDLPNDKKFVVFSRYLSEISAISQLLDEMGIKNQIITGAVKQDLRDDIISKFKVDKDLRALVLNIQVGSLGIDLTVSDLIIYYSHSYSYSDYTQSRSRIHRNGQKNKCTYIHLVAKNTVDEKVLESLEKKGDIAQQIVDRIYKKGDENGK